VKIINKQERQNDEVVAIGRLDGTGRSSWGWTDDSGPTLMEETENDHLSIHPSM
jgi:hypothetical protein